VLLTTFAVLAAAGLAALGDAMIYVLFRNHDYATPFYVLWNGLCALLLTGYFGLWSYLRERTSCRLRNKEFGFVFQFYHLLPELTVLENTLLAPRVEHSWLGYFRGRAATRERAVELLNQLGLGHRLTHRPNQLSGGERQRVAIARALMNRPRILFADEPTGNLDSDTGRQIMAVLEKLHREQGQTIVMVTHDRALARTADRVLVLREGRLDRAET
jgi:ABC-type lipoprotein export system ATPase subunit